MLNTATLFARTPSANVVLSGAAPALSNVSGRSGTRIVFSWTWNENKKNDMALFRSACSSTGCMTAGTPALLLSASGVVAARRSQAFTGAIAAPRNPMSVRSVDRRMRNSRDAHVRHFSTTLEAHQKFATLSSKIPRLKGKMRVIGSSRADSGAKGGRKGKKKIRNARIVVIPRRRSNRAL